MVFDKKSQEAGKMTSRRGHIVLMGSGELTSTMVDVHKQMLEYSGDAAEAVFLDTPAGFQLNADEISRKAQAYFRRHVQSPLSIVSFKSAENTTEFEIETAGRKLNAADYFLIGPGSPTYAVSQLCQTSFSDIIVQRVRAGACLTAASAAALTVGRYTLPVYEIYKVGQPLHWVDGLNILSHFDLNVVVIPHWNNAEGGTHDTRFCYMGEPRFKRLEALLPDDTVIVGLDEHTACIMDFASQTAEIRGLGKIIIRRSGKEQFFGKGDTVPLQMFKEGPLHTSPVTAVVKEDEKTLQPVDTDESNFWHMVHQLEADFRKGLAEKDARKMVNALLDLDSQIWQAQARLESDENISQAREVLRDLMVLIGVEMADRPESEMSVLEPLVSRLLELRSTYRKAEKWPDADRIRDILNAADIVVEDTEHGEHWRLVKSR